MSYWNFEHMEYVISYILFTDFEKICYIWYGSCKHFQESKWDSKLAWLMKN